MEKSDRSVLWNLPKEMLIKIIENMNKVYIVFSCRGDIYETTRFRVEGVFSDIEKAKEYIDYFIPKLKTGYKYVNFFEGKRSELEPHIPKDHFTFLIEEFTVNDSLSKN